MLNAAQSQFGSNPFSSLVNNTNSNSQPGVENSAPMPNPWAPRNTSSTTTSPATATTTATATITSGTTSTTTSSTMTSGIGIYIFNASSECFWENFLQFALNSYIFADSLLQNYIIRPATQMIHYHTIVVSSLTHQFHENLIIDLLFVQKLIFLIHYWNAIK
jgi:hypothetical protein